MLLALLNCVNLLAGSRGRGSFLLNLSLGPGGIFYNYIDARVNSPTIPGLQLTSAGVCLWYVRTTVSIHFKHTHSLLFLGV